MTGDIHQGTFTKVSNVEVFKSVYAEYIFRMDC